VPTRDSPAARSSPLALRLREAGQGDPRVPGVLGGGHRRLQLVHRGGRLDADLGQDVGVVPEAEQVDVALDGVGGAVDLVDHRVRELVGVGEVRPLVVQRGQDVGQCQRGGLGAVEHHHVRAGPGARGGDQLGVQLVVGDVDVLHRGAVVLGLESVLVGVHQGDLVRVGEVVPDGDGVAT